MKKTLFLVLTLGLLVAIPKINGQTHLEPVEGIFDQFDFEYKYHSLLRDILMDGISDYSVVRFLIIPSFEVEQIVAIEEIDGLYYIVHHKPEKSIWYTETNKRGIRIEKKVVGINKADAELYKNLFAKAVKSRRYKEDKILGNDGVTYYFSASFNTLETGKIWTPNEDSVIGKLTEIGHSLIKLATETKECEFVEIDDDIKNRIAKLTSELK